MPSWNGSLSGKRSIRRMDICWHQAGSFLDGRRNISTFMKTLRLAARVEGKSSLARLGLAVHVTAPTIHAGFDGHTQLEIINHGGVPIRLRTGMRIYQLIFEQTLGTPVKGYSGRFSGQGATRAGDPH